MKVNFYEGSDAVSSAKTAIAILSWLIIIIGILFVATPIFDDPSMGFVFLGMGVSGLILKSILKGFYSVVLASEEYLTEKAKARAEAKAETEENKEGTEQ